MKKKINVRKYLILLAVLFLGLTACNKPEEIDAITDKVVEELLDNTIDINNNLDDLNKRMKIVREPIVFNNNLKVVDVGGDCFDYTWYLVAEVDAPIFDGSPLSATDVRILGNRAYVSYHRQGTVYAGGIEIIDISDPGSPVIRSYVEFDGVDINTLAIDDSGSDYGARKIWLAGSSSKKGAVLRQIIANDGYLNGGIIDIGLSKAISDGSITANANGIGYSDDYIYMSAGNSVGGTFQLDRQSLNIVTNEEYTDAKSIALNGGYAGSYQLTLVGGDDGLLNVYRVGTDRTLVRSIPLGSIIHQNVAEPYLGKATVTIREGENVAFIAMNADGMKAVDVESGNVIYTSSGGMLTTGNTHGITVDEKFIYMANSDDGLFIGCIPEGGGEIIDVQRWDLNETGASANMVQTDGDWVFVAKGGGGLKILRKVPNGDFPVVCDFDEEGLPECITNEELCENLLPDFKILLPEQENALINHPEYFTNENREIVLTEDADVSVTFVMEGAGFTNSFGYYTYDVNNPPSSVEDIRGSMRIIFANASAAGGYGGSLLEGDRVDIGNFEEGTVIGYFLIANGWNGSEVTEGLYTFYTIPEFNRDETQQTIMMYSESCGTLLTTFEDVHISGGDRDYNDIVIKTSISPMSAMTTDDLVQLPETN